MLRPIQECCVRLVLLAAILVVPISIGEAHAERPDVWAMDSSGAAVCLLQGTGARCQPLNLHGQRVMVEIEPASVVEGAWKLQLGWPILRGPADLRGGIMRVDRSDLPLPRINGAALGRLSPKSYRYDGILAIAYEEQEGAAVTCCIFPSPTLRAAIEQWTVENRGSKALTVEVPASRKVLAEPTDAMEKPSLVERRVEGLAKTDLAPGAKAVYAVTYTLRQRDEPPLVVDSLHEKAARQAMFRKAAETMTLKTPEPVLDGTLVWANMRLLESPVESQKGLIQGTGTKNYLGGIWANDNVEYAGPPSALLGDAVLADACDGMFRVWLKHSSPNISPSFETYRLSPIGNDRGDQAMMLYGLSNYLLLRGDLQTARELWPLAEKSAGLIRKATNAQGVVASRSDELEGRYPTGKANLSTSSLAYGGYLAAARLAESLDKPAEAREYRAAAASLAKAIESYFGAEVEGFRTYRYFDGCTILRGWISLPLAMGIMERKEGTLGALFSDKLWFERPDGFAAGTKVASTDRGGGWPRETWYALRAAFRAGAADLALAKTKIALRAAMLGPEGPYMDEDGGDLLAPNTLYLSVISEGLFGIEPQSFHRFACTPHMPSKWPAMRLSNICLMGRFVDLDVQRTTGKIRLTVTSAGKKVVSEVRPEGTAFEVDLSDVARP